MLPPLQEPPVTLPGLGCRVELTWAAVDEQVQTFPGTLALPPGSLASARPLTCRVVWRDGQAPVGPGTLVASDVVHLALVWDRPLTVSLGILSVRLLWTELDNPVAPTRAPYGLGGRASPTPSSPRPLRFAR